MTTLQKAIVTATVAILAGAGIYQATQNSKLREQNQALQQQQATLGDQVDQLQRERDDAMKRLSALSAKPTPRLPAPPRARSSRAAWSARRLRQQDRAAGGLARLEVAVRLGDGAAAFAFVPAAIAHLSLERDLARDSIEEISADIRRRGW